MEPFSKNPAFDDIRVHFTAHGLIDLDSHLNVVPEALGSPGIMVQYMSFATTAGYRGYGNTIPWVYWKLGFYDHFTVQEAKDFLESSDYHVPKSPSKNAIMELVGRCQRGLLPYQKCNVEELRSFCEARHLTTKAETVSGLAKALEKADDQATFPKFFALPAELRNTIYELHARSLGDVPGVHQQPPLTVASKQLRHEALPLFYERATFAFRYRAEYAGHPRNRSEGFLKYYENITPGRMFRMPAKNLDLVKLVKFHIIGHFSGLWYEIFLDCSLNLQPDQAVKVVLLPCMDYKTREQSALVAKGLRDMIQNKFLHEGKWKILQADLNLVHEIVERRVY